MIFAKGLQDDGDDGHDGFDHAELESRLENNITIQKETHKKKKKARTPRGDEG